MKNTNLKLNKTKLVARVMIVVVLLVNTITLTGCGLIEYFQSKNKSKAELINDMFESAQYVDGEKIEIVADIYLQQGALSSVFPLEIVVENGAVYLNDIEYEDIVCVFNNRFTFSDLIIKGEGVDEDNADATLEKLQRNKLWYVLTTSNEKKIADKVAMCEIDNAYYFLSIISDGTVIRIHKANLKI
ncbi:MAG: hypothetical protein IKA84_04610 [Clostridia bacterium]|nr:hypothetical protein [Clostridia bacterium]